MTRSCCVFILRVPYTSSTCSIVIYSVFIVLFIVSGNSRTLLFFYTLMIFAVRLINWIFSCLLMNVTNLLYADKNPRSLEVTANKELTSVCNWLMANKLSLNTKKSN